MEPTLPDDNLVEGSRRSGGPLLRGSAETGCHARGTGSCLLPSPLNRLRCTCPNHEPAAARRWLPLRPATQSCQAPRQTPTRPIGRDVGTVAAAAAGAPVQPPTPPAIGQGCGSCSAGGRLRSATPSCTGRRSTCNTSHPPQGMNSINPLRGG